MRTEKGGGGGLHTGTEASVYRCRGIGVPVPARYGKTSKGEPCCFFVSRRTFLKNQSERAKKKTKVFKKTKVPPAPSHDPNTIDGPMYPLFTHKESVNRVHTNDSHHTVYP